MFAPQTNQPASTRFDRRTDNATFEADELNRPTQFFQVIKTGQFSMKPVHEVAPRLGVIFIGDGPRINVIHTTILPLKELSG